MDTLSGVTIRLGLCWFIISTIFLLCPIGYPFVAGSNCWYEPPFPISFLVNHSLALCIMSALVIITAIASRYFAHKVNIEQVYK